MFDIFNQIVTFFSLIDIDNRYQLRYNFYRT